MIMMPTMGIRPTIGITTTVTTGTTGITTTAITVTTTGTLTVPRSNASTPRSNGDLKSCVKKNSGASSVITTDRSGTATTTMGIHGTNRMWWEFIAGTRVDAVASRILMTAWETQ